MKTSVIMQFGKGLFCYLFPRLAYQSNKKCQLSAQIASEVCIKCYWSCLVYRVKSHRHSRNAVVCRHLATATLYIRSDEHTVRAAKTRSFAHSQRSCRESFKSTLSTSPIMGSSDTRCRRQELTTPGQN